MWQRTTTARAAKHAAPLLGSRQIRLEGESSASCAIAPNVLPSRSGFGVAVMKVPEGTSRRLVNRTDNAEHSQCR
jgi:hypothetical protein